MIKCTIVGVTHVGGDMFKYIPQADAIFMKVSHDPLLQIIFISYLSILILWLSFKTCARVKIIVQSRTRKNKLVLEYIYWHCPT